MGGPWPEPCSLEPKTKKIINKDGYRIEFISYRAEENDRVPAILLVPDGVNEQNPAPAVTVWHQHNGEYHIGKSEPAGMAGSPMHHTGVALADKVTSSFAQMPFVLKSVKILMGNSRMAIMSDLSF